MNTESKMKKKSRKEKKSKKHKSHKRRRTSSSESDTGSDEMEWVEVTAKEKKPEAQTGHLEREDWMCQEEFVPTLSKEEMLAKDSNYRRKTSKDQAQSLYKPGQHERELNPYWQNNGRGVPEDNEDSSKEIKLSSSSVGDGGLSWLKKAYKRIEEQAAEEGRTMEDIAVERWGSLAKLKSLIAEAEGKMRIKAHHDGRHKEYYKERHGRKRSYSRERDSSYSRHEKSANSRYERKHTETTYDKNMFKRPHQEGYEEKEENWRLSQGSHQPAWKKKNPSKESNENSKDTAHDKNMFRRPQENMDEKQGSFYASESSHLPAWMKKKPRQESPVLRKNTTDDAVVKNFDSHNSKRNSDTGESPTNIPAEESISISFMSDNEMNNLAAKILKTEMRGDAKLAAQLQSKLDAARNARKSGLVAPSNAEQKRAQEVVLSKVDRHGISRPLVAPDFPSSTKKGHSYGKMSKVKSYFSEESEHSLKKMFEREKLTTADDQLEMFVDAALESKGLTDQDYEIGDISTKVAKKMGQQRQDERDYNKAIQEHKRRNTALGKCEYCFEKMKKHLIISDSQQAYLCLPSYQSLTECHCLIVPKAHVSSSLLMDEDIAEEIKNFKKILVRMFQENKQCVAFVETSINLKNCPHLVIECFPMPLEVGDMAPMYFKKAIQEHGSEWANNKKLIDLFKKDLKHSVPKGLPFFAVEFSQGGGYAHVVEDRDFPRHFGKEIIGGMLEIDSHLCARYRKEDFKEQSKKVLHFTNIWKSYTNKMNIVL